MYLAVNVESDLRVGGAISKLLPLGDEPKYWGPIEDEELLPHASHLLDHELGAVVAAGVGCDAAEGEVLAGVPRVHSTQGSLLPYWSAVQAHPTR